MSIIMTGTTKDQEAGKGVVFSPDLDPTLSIEIPQELIASSRSLPSGGSGTRGDRVAIALDLPDTPETKVLLAWAAAMETALHTLASRTRTAAAADPTERASSACLKCIHRCEKIVVPEDDRLAGVICMLNCPCD